MDFKYTFYWTAEAQDNLEAILEYLKNRWTEREVSMFKSKLANLIQLIRQNPMMFPVSAYNSRLRKAVLSKQTSILYEVSGDSIFLVYLFNNFRDVKRIY